MNILTISLYYKPIWPGFGTRFAEMIIDQSANLGNNVTVFTGRIPKNMITSSDHTQKVNSQQIGCGTVDSHRLWTPSLVHEGFFRRFFVYLFFIIQCFFKILFSSKYDLIIGLHPYPPFFYGIIILAKLKKTKVILTQADLWPNTLLELEILKNGSVYNFISKLTFWTFNLADKIIVITEELKLAMKEFPINHSKISVLNLAVDTEIFKPIDSEKPKNEKFVLMYCGIFSPNYDFDIILHSASQLVDKPIKFVLSGAGELKEELMKKIAEKNLKNVFIENPVPTIEDLVKKMNHADVLLLGMKDNFQAKTAHPSKLFEYMACGKPIISSTSGAVNKILTNSQGGITVEPNDVDGFTNTILELYDNQERLEKLGKNNIEYIKQYHSFTNFRKTLSEIFSNTID